MTESNGHALSGMGAYNPLPKSIRDDVWNLGPLLGNVFMEDRGIAFLKRNEHVRALAKQARGGGKQEW